MNSTNAQNRPERFLNRDITEVKVELGIKDPVEKTGDLLMCSLKKKIHKGYDFKYIIFSLIANKDGVINRILVVPQEKINQEWYNNFSKMYGEPEGIWKDGGYTELSEKFHDDDLFATTIQKGEINLIPCTLSDNPIFVYFKFDTYTIKIIPNRMAGNTFITYERLD